MHVCSNLRVVVCRVSRSSYEIDTSCGLLNKWMWHGSIPNNFTSTNASNISNSHPTTTILAYSGNIFGIGPLEYHGFDPFLQDRHFFRPLGPWGRQDSNLVGHCLMTCSNDGTSTLQSASFSDVSLKNPSCQKSKGI